MTSRLEKFNRVAKLPVEYIESLNAKEQMQLPFIFYGNIIFFFSFILMGSMVIVQTLGTVSNFTIIGWFSIAASSLFLASTILIKKAQLQKGVYLSTFGIILVTFIIVVLTPSSKNPLVYYRSGCFVAVMAICNQVVSLKRRQIHLYFTFTIILTAVGFSIYAKTSLPLDFMGTISAISINTFAIIITNCVIMLLNKYNEVIITNVIESQKKSAENLASITNVLAESKAGLDVGQKLYDETHRVSRNISELNTIHSGITKDSAGLYKNASTISSSSGQMKSQALLMKQSVEEQNKSIDETSLALSAISGELTNLSGIAEQRGTNMKKMMETLNSEKELIRNIVEKVNLVKESSDGIAIFVKTVNEIAQQTGVLAMNAAIEASHAGEKGKGFSVISQEIRKLSEQTTSNAKLIADKLDSNTDVVSATTQLVTNFDTYIARTTEEMRSTIEMLEQLLLSIKGIDTETGKVMHLLSFVVDKSKDTSLMVDKVVGEIDVQDNSLGQITSFSEELAESVNGMKRQLDEIKTAVERIEAEAQLNIKVTERITASLT